VRVAHAPWRDTGHQVVGSEIGQHRHLRVEQRHVDGLALAGAVAVAQCGEDRHRRVQAGEEVGHRHPDLLRSTAGHLVALACHAHQAAYALHGVVVAGSLAVGAGLAESP
jgi:hypothetical protein